MTSAHIDTFAHDNLPPTDQWPDLVFDLPELRFPPQLNCAAELLDRWVEKGFGDRVYIRAPGGVAWTYAEMQEKANRIAAVLADDMGLIPGNRVLLRGTNSPMLAACWFAVMKAGGIAVTTMPLLRAKELTHIIGKARITHALCDAVLGEELRATACPELRRIRYFNSDRAADDIGGAGLEAAMALRPAHFDTVRTAADDVCLIAFTSGTTGVPKATMHFHRDVMAVCACFPRHILRPRAEDVFIGSPPLGFTFGLGGLLLFPATVAASTVLLEKAGPAELFDAIREYGATILFTAPTIYRALAGRGDELRNTSLRTCVSAGEPLPAATRDRWRAATGIQIIDGIGATEMLHIFISADAEHARPGATGLPVPGYRARLVDETGRAVPPGTAGRLAVKGPTGCRYLADERQSDYVRDGWNLTGDSYLVDEDGYFHYRARTDDMIISAGYNIAAPEVEDALLAHPAVAECAVVGAPDEERAQLVKAFVVLQPGYRADDDMVRQLQEFVKRTVAPYKYPRVVVFRKSLPRTETGKLQRFKLREADPSTEVVR
ncbi:AMP-binding protein [Nocardia transvalensis]|uniref:AMP-binding protein n=1 Tax=Nocardia transvalensis TaxID=37333 RepID=UPI0018931124|nr:AMP-binding protein [Nocardia transvalensis]MBF6331131.1 AMP-binding protein [Nocardia transvalensis]